MMCPTGRPRGTALRFLTARWVRSGASRRAAVLLVLALAVLGAVVVCLRAFVPTAEQQADASFGVYAASTSASVDVGDLDPGFLAAAEETVTAAAPGSHVRISSTAIRPDAFAERYVQAPLSSTRYLEDPDLDESFPGRYELDDGRWPQAPFEVVVSQHVLDALPDPGTVSVLSGRVTLDVVGVVTDTEDRHGDLLVGGPGTWESIDRQPARYSYAPVDGAVDVLLPAGAPVRAVTDALLPLLPDVPAVRQVTPATLRSNLTTRDQLLDAPAEDARSDQLAVTAAPLALVVLLVAVLVVAQGRASRRADADRLVAVGVRRGLVVRSQALALVLVASASVVLGLGLGWLVAAGLRATVLVQVADRRLSPLPGPDRTTVVVAVAAVVVVGVGALRLGSTAPTAGRPPRVRRYVAALAPWVRRLAVGGLAVAAVRVDAASLLASYLAVAAVLLASPDLLRLVVALLPARGARALLARRLTTSDLGRASAAAVVVGCCLALPVCAATQLASTRANDASYTFSRVLPGQVWVQNTGGSGGGDVAGAARAVATVPGIGAPVVLRDMTYAVPYRRDDAAAFFTRTPTSGGFSNGTVMVATSAAEVRRFLGDGLPAGAEAVLDGGGVLDFTAAEGDQRLEVRSARGRLLSRTPVLDTLDVDVSTPVAASFGGAVLLGAARELGLPVNPPRTFVWTDVDIPTAKSAAAAAVTAGYDTDFVQYATPPPPPDLPTSAYALLAGLVLGGFAVLLAVVGGQARRLRSYGARLVALGLRPRWAGSVLLLQAALVVGVGVVSGVGAGLLGLRVTAERYAVTAVPVVPIAVACVATLLAAGLATALAARSLAAADRPPSG